MFLRALIVGFVLLVATSVGGAVDGAVAVAAPPGPQVRCELDDERLAEASGLVVGPDGPAVVNDSGNPSTVYRLDPRCGVAAELPVVRDGRDVEDLARADDGTLWLADTGDNRRARPTIAILRLAPDGGQVDVPLAYPDGPHDAETLILPDDGRPVIVTKDLGGRSGVYTTDAPLPAAAPERPVSLRRVGEVAIPPTTTANGSSDPQAAVGGGLITGGALTDDGRVAGLRTYTDAWLYPVTGPVGTADGVVAALRGAPVQVPLPGEPQGEAIAFEPDGTLLSASESPDEVGPASATRRGALRAVTGAAALAGTPGTPTPAAPATSAAPPTAAAPPAEDGDPGIGAAGWVGVAIAVVVGGGGVLYAVRRWG